MNAPLAYGCMGLVLAGCAAYALSVLRGRRRDRQAIPAWQRAALEPVPSPAHDALELRDDEEYAFAEAIIAYFEREATP